MDSNLLSRLYQAAHNQMRNIDGLQPQDAFDELLKYIFFKERDENTKSPVELMGGFQSPTIAVQSASLIRTRFSTYVGAAEVAPARWVSEGISLSDQGLLRVHEIFQGCRLSTAGLDLRSAALREFLSGPLRKSLGIFLTPEAVVDEIISALAPTSGQRVIDPACGSGTFLTAAAAQIGDHTPPLELYGLDKNARMIQLAEFNCGHLPKSPFHRVVADSLGSWNSPTFPNWYKQASFDVVVANPPFGVSVARTEADFQGFLVCKDRDGKPLRKQASELIFLERCVQLLKPGGWLGIIVPRSVLTNKGYDSAREALSSIAAIRGMITLPSETFAATGANTTTVVLFVERFKRIEEHAAAIVPVIARVDNVGFDTTGRPRKGSQLTGLGTQIRSAMLASKPTDRVSLCPAMPADETFLLCADVLNQQDDVDPADGVELRDYVEFAVTGATPARIAYSDEGLFLVKVGNLTGAGISWLARDRNFISGSITKKYETQQRQLRPGDILLTSSAHAARYIGKKVDIVSSIPTELGEKASFTGEVMLVRPASNVDPYRLLAYLRSPSVMRSLQNRVRGQTAHLHPSDLLSLRVNQAIYDSPKLTEMSSLLRVEARLNTELNALAFRQIALQSSLGEPDSLELAEEV